MPQREFQLAHWSLLPASDLGTSSSPIILPELANSLAAAHLVSA